MKDKGTLEIETSRLLLRRFSLEDAGKMFENWANNPQATRYLAWSAHQTPVETEEVLRYWERQYPHLWFYEWAICLKEAPGNPIGSIGLMDSQGRREMETGYCLGPDWWRHGYATEALTAVLYFGLYEVGCRRIVAKHAIDNPASGRVMQKAGMSMRIGEIVPVETANGVFDCMVYEIAPSPRMLANRRPSPPPGYRVRREKRPR